MTAITPGVVDVVVLRRVGRSWHVLILERAPGVRCAGAWEIVHGSIEPGEGVPTAARRELREETGLAASRLYTIAAHPFYLAKTDTLQVAIAFAAIVDSAEFTLSAEHRRAQWVTMGAAKKMLAWPRTHDLLRQVAWILRTGDAGAAEAILRVT